MLGFQFTELSSGTYAYREQPDQHRRLFLRLETRADSAARWLRSPRAELAGTIEADGITEGAPLAGAVELAPFTGTVHYSFGFTGDDGKPYRFEGEKQLRLGSPAQGLTELRGRLLDGERQDLATTVTHFDVRADLFDFFTSWRLR